MTAIAIGLTLVSAGALRPQTRETKTTTKTKKAPPARSTSRFSAWGHCHPLCPIGFRTHHA